MSNIEDKLEALLTDSAAKIEHMPDHAAYRVVIGPFRMTLPYEQVWQWKQAQKHTP